MGVETGGKSGSQAPSHSMSWHMAASHRIPTVSLSGPQETGVAMAPACTAPEWKGGACGTDLFKQQPWTCSNSPALPRSLSLVGHRALTLAVSCLERMNLHCQKSTGV